MRRLMLLAVVLVLGTTARADDMRPAYLEMKEIEAGKYTVVFKVPAQGPAQRLALYTRFPVDFKSVTPVETSYAGNAFVERSTISRDGGIAGAEIFIDGLSTISTDVLVRIQGLEGNSQTFRLSPSSPSLVVARAPDSLQVAKTYTILGIHHILVGLDHLLFILCLMIVTGVNRKLLITITGFTIAHSLTLVLSTLGIVDIPTPPVEAVIALSIVFLASEIARGNTEGLTFRYPVAVSMAFGLLHGLGFAAVLGEIGLPANEIPTSLLFFNIGVELGQLIFIGAVLIVALLGRRILKILMGKPVARRVWEPAAAYVIGSVTTFWTIERITSF